GKGVVGYGFSGHRRDAHCAIVQHPVQLASRRRRSAASGVALRRCQPQEQGQMSALLGAEMIAETALPATVPLLEIRELVVAFPSLGASVNAVRGVNLVLRPGQSVAILGES